jgi:hypothetical protein
VKEVVPYRCEPDLQVDATEKRACYSRAIRKYALNVFEDLLAIKSGTGCTDFARVLVPVRAAFRRVAPECSNLIRCGDLEKWRISAGFSGGRYWD